MLAYVSLTAVHFHTSILSRRRMKFRISSTTKKKAVARIRNSAAVHFKNLPKTFWTKKLPYLDKFSSLNSPKFSRVREYVLGPKNIVGSIEKWTTMSQTIHIAPSQIHLLYERQATLIAVSSSHSTSISMETMCFPGTMARPRILGSSFSSTTKIEQILVRY